MPQTKEHQQLTPFHPAKVPIFYGYANFLPHLYKKIWNFEF